MKQGAAVKNGAVPARAVDALCDVVDAAGSTPSTALATARRTLSLLDWRVALEETARQLFPFEGRATALRRLGGEFAEAIGRTPVGSVLAFSATQRPPDQVMARFQLYAQVVRPGMEVTMQMVSEGHWMVVIFDPDPMPDFVAGCFARILGFARVETSIEVIDRETDHYVLDLQWSA